MLSSGIATTEQIGLHAEFTTPLRRQYLPWRRLQGKAYKGKLTREVQDCRQRIDKPFNKYATDLLTIY